MKFRVESSEKVLVSSFSTVTEIIDIRERVSLALREGRPLLVFPFGRGCGFGAEWVGTLKAAATAIANGYGLRLYATHRGSGVFVERGWEDYFESLFVSSESQCLRWVDLTSRRIPQRFRSDFLEFMSGAYVWQASLNWSALNRITDCGFSGDWWHDMRCLAEAMWEFNSDTRRSIDEIAHRRERLERYIAVHVRRGDKHLERANPTLKRYADALDSLDESTLPVLLFGDDRSVLDELAAALSEKRDCYVCAGTERGFHESEFNMLGSAARYKANCHFLADMAMMKEAVAFVGDSQSNVFYMARYLRGNIKTYGV